MVPASRSAHIDDAVPSLLQVAAARGRVVHPRAGASNGAEGGGDVDCVVEDLDPLWGLRLGSPWRLCQRLHYDVRGMCWSLERDGRLLALDILEDRDGLNRLAFPTSLALTGSENAVPAPVRAAYLTAKRVRKNDRDPAQWRKVAELAAQDPDSYGRALEVIFGKTVGRALPEQVMAGRVPDDGLWTKARRAQHLARIGNPLKAMHVMRLWAGRVLDRGRNPAGLHVLVAGPDGSGKSTVASALPKALGGVFPRHLHVHWKPGLLPRAGAMAGRPPADASDPHGRPPHGVTASAASLAYHWADFFLGGWLRLWTRRARAGLVVVERGWWDLAVDPRRYRLRASRRLVRVLGSLLPAPDIALMLETPADVILGRKAELPRAELERQTRAWRDALPPGVPRISIDASVPPEEAIGHAREEILKMLEERTMARLGAGWVSLPSRARPRWVLPRGPRAAAATSLALYQPVTIRGRIGWELARAAARLGGFRFLPRGEAPSRDVREALAAHLPPRSTVAVMKSNHPGRHVALVMDHRDGRPRGVAKLAADPSGKEALAREAAALQGLATQLPAPLRAPELSAAGDGLVLLEPARWRPRLRPWILPEEVAAALGAFYRSGASPDGRHGRSHGDCAPWNLLRCDDGWMLVDWEDATDDAPPFFDVFHYLVQAHALLGRPSYRALIDGLSGRGWVGRALRAYANAAGLDFNGLDDYFDAYLEASADRLRLGDKEGPGALEARRRLLGRDRRGHGRR